VFFWLQVHVVLQDACYAFTNKVFQSAEVQAVTSKTLILFLAVGILAGCQTSTYVSSAATDGDGVTCNEISQAFNAYQQDRQSATAWSQLAQLISPTAGNYADMGVQKAAQYYDQIKATTNLALAVRGCQPVQ
jgi:hypothetical protein